MELLNQPFSGQFGDRLIELLNSAEYHTLNIVVAFAKSSGVLRIKDSMQDFREQGGVINVYVGVDMRVTSYEGLTNLLLHTDSLNIVHFENSQTFHPKIYHFSGKNKGLVAIGSHNLTAGGLWTNIESSVLIPLDVNNTLLADLDIYIESLTSLKGGFLTISCQEDIDKLLENGYILREVTQAINHAKSKKRKEGQKPLFSNSVSASLPSVRKEDITKGESTTIWFETRKMTGGSRNILDLSKKSLLQTGDPTGTFFDLGEPNFIRGTVEFFGLNPSDSMQSKDITLNFEGIDYIGNTILFPEGKNANGTWRLQIKGVSSSGRSITEAFRATGEEHYLVEKIVTFTKIDSHYYLISVFPESNLQTFQDASLVSARNGASSQARWFGLLKAT